ncbi:TonB-dependent receptor [Myxococcota bacterium]|nr:TonB-dependent receptor [Myxococcota bacterium]MBU1534895.1 TonB-dependent receptor [Myxococcota bacterium]
MKIFILLLLSLCLFPLKAAGQSPEGSASLAVDTSKVVPPKPLKVVPATYPAEGYADPPGITVHVKVHISKDGTVLQTEVVRSGGAPFDREAVKAAKLWHFRPATYNGKPIAVKITIPFAFPPRIKPRDPSKNNPKNATGDQANPGTKKPVKIPGKKRNNPNNINNIKVTHITPLQKPKKPKKAPDGSILVTGILKKPRKSAVGEFKINRAVLTAAPQPSAGDMLRTAPGFYVGHPQGEGMANALFLRGFDAAHGQDFELWAGEVPINLTGHIHAQGYADMHFIIPETVLSLKVVEGVFDPSQGDFAVAGSGYFNYGITRRGLHAGITLGSFNTSRLLFIWAPEGESRETFVAVSVKESDGYGTGNRSSQSVSAMGRYALALGKKTTVVFHMGGFASRSILPGVLRLNDIESGAIDLYDTYNDPTARAQSGFFSRFETSAKVEKRLSRKGEMLKFTLWALRTNSRLRQNFTGYLLSFADQPDLIGAGDLHQQVNLDEAYGASLTYKSGTFKKWDIPMSTHTGITLRSDWIEQTEDLLFPAQNMIWRNTVDTSVQVLDMGLFGGAQVQPSDMFRFSLGFRANYLVFEVNDRLGNWQYNTPTNQSHQLGYKRDAMGLAMGPRLGFEIGPFYKYQVPQLFEGFSFIGSYGEGFRSPPPRSLQEGEKAPFTKVKSTEAGIKWFLTKNKQILFKLTGFYTYLSDDYVYDPTTAMAKSIGDTSRLGAMAFLSARPFKGFLFSGSLTYAYAVLEGSPMPTPEDPQPGQKAGDLIPYIPPWVGRVDAGYTRTVGNIKGSSVTLKAGLGYSYLGPRPIPFSQWSDPVHLADASVSASWKQFTLRLEATNIFNTAWHDMELNFVSQWNPNVPTRLPQRHVVAGAPRTVMATLTMVY